ncbi:hypothetical protein [Vibrio parahaemolyticus]|uniref:hypothetical protein n=1 Tax=Vibrio parahaemolyticus TaxID=670 RepID=UPI00084B43AF|nr:hypothetical protein [Vibrio parahaemolyticus]ODZ63184.1 hypothetical protein BBM44_10300 [Vibrio parahaemolyticus]
MHPLQNGSQATNRPANKPPSGLPGWFTESGENNVPSYPGADWFNHVIAETLNLYTSRGVAFDPLTDENLSKCFSNISNPWVVGGVVTDPYLKYSYKNQLGEYVNYRAPLASVSNPVTIPSSPNDDFVLAEHAEYINFNRKGVSQAVSQAISLNLQNKIDNLISVQDWGAIGDGQSHPISEFFSGLAAAQMVYPHVTSMDDEIDWAAIQACVNSGEQLVKFDFDKDYQLNHPVSYRTLTTFYSPVYSISYSSSRTATFRIKRDSWDGSDAIFSKQDRDSSYQSIMFDSMSFAGYANISASDLQNAEDIGVSAIDVSYIRDGAIIRNCNFEFLRDAVNQLSTAGYLGFCVIDNCHVRNCYRAFDCKPTTQLTVANSRIYDCYDWIVSNTVLLSNVSFNNSTFSSNLCSIHANNIHSLNCWYEGGNNWFDLSQATRAASLVVHGGHLSEAFSDLGYRKSMVNLNHTLPNVVEFKGGIALPTNTRVFNSYLADDWSDVTLLLSSISNIGDLWCLDNTTLDDLIFNGLDYEGVGNSSRSGYVDNLINDSFFDKSSSFRAIGVLASKTTSTGVTLNVSTNKAGGASSSSLDRNAFVTLNLVGNSNGAGGTSIYAVQFSLLHGYGTAWGLCEGFSQEGVPATSLTLNGFIISISSESNTGCELTIVPTHAGSKSETNWFVALKSSNIEIS